MNTLGPLSNSWLFPSSAHPGDRQGGSEERAKGSEGAGAGGGQAGEAGGAKHKDTEGRTEPAIDRTAADRGRGGGGGDSTRREREGQGKGEGEEG